MLSSSSRWRHTKTDTHTHTHTNLAANAYLIHCRVAEISLVHSITCFPPMFVCMCVWVCALPGNGLYLQTPQGLIRNSHSRSWKEQLNTHFLSHTCTHTHSLVRTLNPIPKNSIRNQNVIICEAYENINVINKDVLILRALAHHRKGDTEKPRTFHRWNGNSWWCRGGANHCRICLCSSPIMSLNTK